MNINSISEAKPSSRPPHLPSATTLIWRDRAVLQARGAVLPAQIFVAQVIGGVDDHFGQVGQLVGEIPEFVGVAQDVAHIDPEHLAVFEGVQQIAPGRLVAGQPAGRGGSGASSSASSVWSWARFLAVFSASTSRTTGKRLAYCMRRKSSHRKSLTPSRRASDSSTSGRSSEASSSGQLGRSNSWATNSRKCSRADFGVGRERQQVGEVFDQHRRGAQLALFVGVGDLVAVLVGDVERVVHLAARRFRFLPGRCRPCGAPARW